MAKHERSSAPDAPETITVSPDEIAYGEFAAEHDNAAATLADHALDSEIDTDVTASEGRRISTAFAMKNFVPDVDWIMKHVVSQGKGTHVLVGRITGSASKAVRKTNNHQDKILESIALEGKFTAEFKETGEIRSVSVVYFPRAFALEIESSLAMTNGEGAALLDVDIGLEASGKSIPYEWTVTSYLEGKAERALRKLRQSRRIGQPAVSGPTQPRLAHSA